MNRIPVIEIFGPTIQGEGMVIGQKTMFVRTAGCDYSCSWCDSSFTWDGSAKNEIKNMTTAEVLEALYKLGGNGFSHVTISGGNPALLKNLGEIIGELKSHGIEVAIETQGSKWQDWFTLIDDLTISPKPPSSGMTTDFGILSNIIKKTSESESKVSLKIVIFDDADFDYAKLVHKKYPDIPLYLQVGNDDISTVDKEALIGKLLQKYEWLIDKAMVDSELKNVRILPQLHTLLWGNKRGV